MSFVLVLSNQLGCLLFGKLHVCKGRAIEVGVRERDSQVLYIMGSQTSVEIPLPERPKKVKLDPDYWILSDKASARKRGAKPEPFW